MKAIEEEKLTPDVRNEIVRDLVMHMYGYVKEPKPAFASLRCSDLFLSFHLCEIQKEQDT